MSLVCRTLTLRIHSLFDARIHNFWGSKTIKFGLVFFGSIPHLVLWNPEVNWEKPCTIGFCMLRRTSPLFLWILPVPLTIEPFTNLSVPTQSMLLEAGPECNRQHPLWARPYLPSGSNSLSISSFVGVIFSPLFERIPSPSF
jgi:hypothetical protein